MSSLSIFEARSWLAQKKTSFGTNLSKQDADPKQHLEFAPQDFILPEWTGEELISKSAIDVRNLIDELTESMFAKFIERPPLTLRLEQMIYEEFIHFAQTQNTDLKNLDSPRSFWSLWRNLDKTYETEMQQFFRCFSFKTVIVYLFKIRFLLFLSEAVERPCHENNLINPNSFLEKFFPNGSSFELQCEGIGSNVYSWFIPSPRFKKKIAETSKKILNLSITDLMKISSYTHDYKDKTLNTFYDKEYSRTLSHESFGLFMSKLLTHLPQWLRPESKKTKTSILSCKFSGNNLNSLALSYWLSQESSLKTEISINSHLLLPCFTSQDGEKASFIKICQEFEFLTFMARYCKEHKLAPIQVISDIMKTKTQKSFSGYQTSLLLQHDDLRNSAYDRIFLNASSLPKTNTHYHLLRNIEKELSSLKDSGLLYVLSTQQLFVLSRTEKLEQLFSSVKLHAIFDFDELKGRGEIPSYLYIFSKRETLKKKGLDVLTESSKPRESFFNFRFRGTLTHFASFSKLNQAFENFLTSKNSLTGTLYQKELEGDLEFQFFQNTIIGSRPLKSDITDSDKVTHPNFLKRLTSSCISMDHFFRIEGLKKERNTTSEGGLFTSYEQGVSDNAYLLILDYSHSENVSMELCSMKIYTSKVEQYGTAFFEYFMLLPKVPDININLFKEFFEGPLGNQVVQLALSGNRTKLKGHLNTLLIPKFFLSPDLLPDDKEKPFDLFLKSDTELLRLGAQSILESFLELSPCLWTQSEKYPWHILGLISNFKRNIHVCLNKFQATRNKGLIEFDNPIIVEDLKCLETSSFYPSHKDVFVDFKTTKASDLYMPLESTVLGKQENESSYYLILKHQDRPIIMLHGPENTLLFLDFLFSKALGKSILTLLTGLRIPEAESLNHIIEKFKEGENIFASLYTELSNIVKQIFAKKLLS